MGGKALLAVVCWLTLSEALGEALKTVNSSIADNASEESAPRLYHNIPAGVYASGTPYGSYSFHAPAIISAPALAGSQVKETLLQDSGFLRNLRDSYGKFVQTPQTAAYKSAFPQQYVQLQQLPAHLSQPLVAAAPSFQYKQTAPHFFFGSQQYRVPSLHQAATPTPITRFTGLSQPLVYAENIRSFAPSSGFHVHRSSPQHLTNAQAFQGNAASFQRLQERPQTHVASDSNKDAKQQATHNENGQIEAAPAQTSVTAFVNGKQTVITLETKPPLPLLDLNLLEPLTFDNPLVPQVQHFLPRINSATYHTLPQFVNDQKKRQKEIIVTNTNSYDSGPIIVGKPKQAPKKKQNKPRPQIIPERPTVTVEESPNASPEISYEINQPGYKETYNEQVVSYNKKTNMKPVTFSYNEKTHKEPVTYSFSHSSKEPLQVKHVEYESDPENPKQLIYKLQPEEQDEEDDDDRPPPLQAEDSGESSDESEEESPVSQPQRAEHHSHHGDSPRHSKHHSEHHEEPSRHSQHHSGHHEDSPRHSQHNSGLHESSPKHHNEHQTHHGDSPRYSQHQHHGDSPRHSQHHGGHQGHHEQAPKHHHHHSKHHSHHEDSPRNSQHHSGYHVKPPSHSHHHGDYHGKSPAHPSHSQYHGEHQGHHEGPPRQAQHHGEHREHHESPRQSHHLRPEHREEHNHRPNQEVHQVVHLNPNQYSQPLTVTVQNGDIHPIITEYEEDIRLLQPHSAPIKVDPNQHVQLGPSTPHQSASPSPAPQKLAHHHHEQEHTPAPHSRPYSSPAPHIIEKSKHIIIKEDEETPDEVRSHAEQLMAQMLDQEENNEEDFEKAYKASAFGFPAFEESAEVEKDVYDPESYGAPRFHNEYNIESNPFQQYQEEGDEFPKSSRANYKDIRDKTKEDYFSEFSVNKPQSFSDQYRQKEDYFKTYKNNKPEKLFAHDEDEKKKNNKKSEKYIAAPTYLFHTSSKPKQKQYFAAYKAAPKALYAYEYPKQAPRDNGAYGSRLYHRYKTHFVEPQFQYGFEPIAAPILLDSELAAMASNNSPETEKPGIRKKIYKENWYIKKTSTTAGKPS